MNEQDERYRAVELSKQLRDHFEALLTADNIVYDALESEVNSLRSTLAATSFWNTSPRAASEFEDEQREKADQLEARMNEIAQRRGNWYVFIAGDDTDVCHLPGGLGVQPYPYVLDEATPHGPFETFDDARVFERQHLRGIGEIL